MQCIVKGPQRPGSGWGLNHLAPALVADTLQMHGRQNHRVTDTFLTLLLANT